MVSLLLAAVLHQSSFEPGASLRVYDIQTSIEELSQLVPGQTPNIDKRIDKINFSTGGFGLKDHFYVEITGEFQAKTDGTYTFRMTSDDGSELSVGNKVVATNDEIHPPTSVEGKVNLRSGWHKFLLRFFEDAGGEELKLEWKGPQQADFVVAGTEVLRCPANLTRVTAPGQKFLMGAKTKRRPGSGMPLTKLHPGWDLVPLRPKGFEPQVGALDFLPDGSLLVSTFKPNQSGEFLPDLKDGKLWRLDGLQNQDASAVTAHLVAEGLQEPLGVCVTRDANRHHVYVSQRTEVTELIDTNNDGVYETKKTVAKAWVADNYHHFTFGLVERDGFLYAGLSTSITFGAPGINGPNPPNRGCMVKINPNTYDANLPMANVEFVSGGHRTPNGVSLGPYGLILVGENQGAWQPADKVNIVAPGKFFGHYNNTAFKTTQYPNGGVPGPFDEQPLCEPVLYLPHNECANSPGQMVTMKSGPFADQILITDVKYGGLRRGWLEQVDGQWQGGVVQYSQGFEVGTTRLAYSPDGSLVVGGTGATETWAWTDPVTKQWTTFGLQRIKRNDKVPFEIEWVHATPLGFRARFTKPIGTLKPNNLIVKQWDYEPTPEYGGDKKHKETLTVKSVKASKDGMEADIEIAGLKEGRIAYLNFDLKSKSSEDLWATECWYTLTKQAKPEVPISTTLLKPNPRVLVFSKTAAFRHDSIPTGIEAIRQMAAKRGFSMAATEDASQFNDTNLANFDVVVFLSTTGDVLDPEQQSAFERFIRAGGGYVGIHAATDTEYEWPFYTRVVGAQFKGHPAICQARVKVEDRFHPSSSFLPNNWTRVDEWYNFRENPRPGVRVLCSLDESSYSGGTMGDHPIMWCQEVEGGRSWYTEFGHTQSSYSEWFFLESLYQGILWTAQARRPADALDTIWKGTKGWVQQDSSMTNSGPNPEHLFSKDDLSDARVHVEFKIPKGSNSGVYLQGRYEVQILDSFGKAAKDLEFSDCGGIYQRWANESGFEGTRPLINAFRGPDEWNSYDILFRAPRFDSRGRKTENARFIEVRLNGVIVQHDVEVTGPTRAAYFDRESKQGPIVLQADHGPVSFRNVWSQKVKL